MLDQYLMLKRKIIGVKFFFSEKDYENCTAKTIKGVMSYCTMIKKASTGAHFKANIENAGCSGGTPAVGLAPRTDDYIIGIPQYGAGLYCNIGTSARADKDIRYMPPVTKGLEIAPVNELDDYDVALVIDSPYNIMRIVQAYSYSHNIKKDFRLEGNQAICSEVTAEPYMSQDINISLLCSGTRFFCKWDDEDMAVGIPQRLMESIEYGLRNTLNATESDQRKEKMLADKLAGDVNVTMKTAYYYQMSSK